MLRDESKFHTTMMKWLRYNLDSFPKSFLIETKITRRGKQSFPYRELSEKEERLLLKGKHKTILQTHSDYSQFGTLCDGSCISGGGFIFLKWMRRANKEFFIIDIDKFIEHRDKSKRKSLTESEAREISYLVARHV